MKQAASRSTGALHSGTYERTYGHIAEVYTSRSFKIFARLCRYCDVLEYLHRPNSVHSWVMTCGQQHRCGFCWWSGKPVYTRERLCEQPQSTGVAVRCEGQKYSESHRADEWLGSAALAAERWGDVVATLCVRQWHALSNTTPNMSEASSKAIVYKPPNRPQVTRPSVIFYGAIQAEPAWQTSLATSLSDLPIDILDPRRDDWDSSWVEDISFPKFKEQVKWEMDYAKVADVIVFYFAPGALTPVTLLELGMYAGTGKAIVCCPQGFYKRGNVQIVCLRYDIELLETLDDLNKRVRTALVKKLVE